MKNEININSKCFLGVLLFIGLWAKGQTLQYSYDKNGGCVKRKLYVCSNCPQNGRMAAPLDTVKNVDTKHVIGVFPNPTQNELNVNITNVESDEIINFSLCDDAGRVLLTYNNQTTNSVINIGTLRTGIYYLLVNVGNDRKKVYKVIKIE